MATGSVQEIGKDPLYQKRVTTFATTYLLGYRSVFIRPNNNGADTSFENLLPPGTIAVDIPMVKDSPLHIVIHAENIVFARGTKYLYRTKDLTISCRSVIFVSHPSDLNTPVTFDLTGEAQSSIPAEPQIADHGTDRVYIVGLERPEAKEYGSDGSKGIDGTDGGTGFAGGKFTFKGDLQLPADAKDLFKIVTTGGKGGKGGNGGQGGTGGNGWRGFGDVPLPERDFRRMLDLLPGRAGGDGGKAGRPGYGGSGGDVNIIWTVNGETPMQDEKFKRFENLFIIQADAGQNGEPGEGGLGGPPGKDCQETLWSEILFSEISPKPVESYVKSKPICRIELGFGCRWDVQFFIDPAAIRGGATGSQGVAAIGVAGAQPSAGKVTIVPADANVLLGLQKYSPRQLLMIIERLSFEYFVYFSSQFYHSTENLEAVEKIKSPFGGSLAWISSICDLDANEKNRGTVGPDTLLWKEVHSSFGTLCRRINGMKDIFDCSLISVEQPHLGLWEVESILKNYNDISSRAKVVREYLREGAAKRLEIRVQLKGIAAQVTSELSKRTKAIEDLKLLKDKIVSAKAHVSSKLSALRGKLTDLEDSIRREVNCDVSEILNALGTVSLFFSPHAGPAFAIGAVATMAVAAQKSYAASFESLPTEFGGHIEKSYLYDRIDTLKENSLKLKDDLADTFKKHKEGISDGGLSMIRVQTEKFERMSEEYLTKIKATAPVKTGYQELIDAIQDKNDLLDAYNETYLSISSSDIHIDSYTKNAKNLEASTGNFADDELQLIDAFLTRACSDMGQMAIRSLYNAGRVMNCASLSFSRVFTPLATLQSFSGLTPQVLEDAFKVYLLGQDVRNLNDIWTHNPSVGMDNSPPIVMALHAAEYESLFESLRQKHQFTFALNPKNSAKLGFGSDWWDVRLRALEVYLPGAVRIPGQNDDENERPHINLRISTSGKATYLDKEGKTHKFELPQIVMPFRYTYARNSVDGSEDLIGSKPVGGDAFLFSLEPNHQRDYIIQSPFVAWTVNVSDEKQVKVADCKKIIFKFHLTYRARQPKV